MLEVGDTRFMTIERFLCLIVLTLAKRSRKEFIWCYGLKANNHLQLLGTDLPHILVLHILHLVCFLQALDPYSVTEDVPQHVECEMHFFKIFLFIAGS